MADCLNIAANSQEHEEVRAQVAHSDLVILTKCDLVTDDQIEEVRTLVAELNPKARILRSDEDDCTVLALDLKIEARDQNEPKLKLAPSHAAGFDSLSFDIGKRSTIRYAFEEFLAYLPPEVIRAKGIVPLDGEHGRLIFHRVAERLDMSFDPNRQDDGMLVLIGKNLDKAALKSELDSLFEAF
jgi:G3E family GTPase